MTVHKNDPAPNTPTNGVVHANESFDMATILSNEVLPSSDTLQSQNQVHSAQAIDELAQRLIQGFNHSPFNRLCGMTFHYENQQLIGKVSANPDLIGNVAFNILHGGVAATLLDGIGGMVGMLEIYKRGQGSFSEQVKKTTRLATVDLRIDYLAPGRGMVFIATAEIIRMGRKGCTTRMLLTNEEGKPIAHGLASYAF